MKTTRLVPGKPYLFEWNDTYNQSGWMTEDEIEDSTLDDLHQSSGLFVRETEVWYVIATHKNTNPTYKPWGDVNWIPKGCVRSVKAL